jgi:hypothetical protein
MARRRKHRLIYPSCLLIFQVLGQQQQAKRSHYLTVMQVQNLAWVLDLVSDKEGTYKIPAIPIKTNAGELYHQAVQVYIVKACITNGGCNKSDNSVFIDVQLEKSGSIHR